MATTFTTNVKLQRPATADRNWDVPIRANLDALDALSAIGGLCVTPAEVPSTTLGVAVAPGSFRMLSGAPASYAGGTATLPASSTSYVFLTDGGTLLQSTTLPATPYVPLAMVVTDAATITAVADLRVQCATQGAPALVPVMTKTAAYTAVDSDGVLLADATGGAFSITLMSAVGRPGKQVTVKRVSASNNVTVATTASQTIDGAATYVLTVQNATATMVSDGTNWAIISKI